MSNDHKEGKQLNQFDSMVANHDEGVPFTIASNHDSMTSTSTGRVISVKLHANYPLSLHFIFFNNFHIFICIYIYIFFTKVNNKGEIRCLF